LLLNPPVIGPAYFHFRFIIKERLNSGDHQFHRHQQNKHQQNKHQQNKQQQNKHQQNKQQQNKHQQNKQQQNKQQQNKHQQNKQQQNKQQQNKQQQNKQQQNKQQKNKKQQKKQQQTKKQHMYCTWLSSYQEGWVVVPLTGLTPPCLCTCLKPGPGFPISHVIFLCSKRSNKPAQIRFRSKKNHTIIKMNDNINMDNTIAGSMNACS
jgi:flagellar biosynthesis GTPase FlhF